MTHATELQLSMHADNALPADEATGVVEHLKTCTTCQARFAIAQAEARFIATAMRIESFEEIPNVVVPKFSRPVSLRGFAFANVVTALVFWLAQFLWKTLFGELFMNAATWATSVYLPDIYDVLSATALYLLEEGTAMLDAYLVFVVAGVLTFTALWIFLIYRNARTTLCACLLLAVCGTMVAPAPALALDFRRDNEIVTIAKSETIDDTLVVAADTVLIEGTVTGDLIAVGRRIDISGSVEGSSLTFAETVTVRGKVGGLVLGAASSLEFDGATVGGDLWAAGEKVAIDNETLVGRNATVATQSAVIEGVVKKDLYAFAETVELSGELGEDLEAFAKRVRLLGEAHVGGNVRYRSRNKDRLHRAETVRVDGEVEFLTMPEAFEDKNKYATFEFYLWQAARLISAFLVGLALLWLVPGFRSLSIGAGSDGLKAAGIGFLAVVSVPIMAVLVAITLVGVPISVIAIFAWLLGIYLAKIVVGAFVGRMLLNNSESLPLILLSGLTIVVIAVNLPIIGGIINFVLTIVGMGLIVQYVIRAIPSRDPMISTSA